MSAANIHLQAKASDGTLGTVVLAGTTFSTPGTLSVEGKGLLLAT